MQPTDGLGAQGGEVVMALGQQTKDGNMVLAGDHPQARVAQGHDGGRAGVVGIGLVDRSRVQQPRPRRQRRRHVNDHLAGGDELSGQQGAGAGGSLDRPSAGRERCRPCQQTLMLAAVGTDAQLGNRVLVAVEGRRGVGPLVGVDSNDEHAQPPWVLPDGMHHGGQS